jgi:dimethylargininase
MRTERRPDHRVGDPTGGTSMSKEYGAQNMVGRLRKVVVRRPDEAMAAADPATWHYAAPIDLPEAQAAHDAFMSILKNEGVELLYHDEPLPLLSDSVFVFDPVLMTDAGALILRMGKALRRGEEDAFVRFFQRQNMPVLGRLQGDAHCEGGDTLWLDHDTLAVGIGFRTDYEAVRQMRQILDPIGVKVLAYELPYFTGPEACLHLLSLISPIDVDLAVAYPPLMPVPFWKELKRRGIQLVEVPEEEFRRWQGTNILAIAPRRVAMLDHNPATQRLLEEAGVTVFTFPGAPLSFKAEGGPTCLTRPVLRDDA